MIKGDEYLPSNEDKPMWLEYPKGLTSLVEAGKVDLTPWHIMKIGRAKKEIPDLFKRYQRTLFPFAFRQDNDDIACFEKDFGERVVVIHNFASKGWETEVVYPGFSDWLDAAEEDAENW